MYMLIIAIASSMWEFIVIGLIVLCVLVGYWWMESEFISAPEDEDDDEKKEDDDLPTL